MRVSANLCCCQAHPLPLGVWLPRRLCCLLHRYWLSPAADSCHAFGSRNATQEVASAHIRAMQAKHIVDIEGPDRHVVKPWFNGKLTAPSVPNWKGGSLSGGRLTILAKVGALVYKRREHINNFFVWPDSGMNHDFQRTARSYQLRIGRKPA